MAIEEVQNYKKIAYIKSIFENGWCENGYPSQWRTQGGVGGPTSSSVETEPLFLK